MAKSVEQKEFEENEYSQWCENNKEHIIRFLKENLNIYAKADVHGWNYEENVLTVNLDLDNEIISQSTTILSYNDNED
jgi:hypothetical protein